MRSLYAMTDDTPLPIDLPSVRRKKLTVDFAGGNQSSNGGVLLLRESERSVGVCRLLTNTMTDRRDPNRIRHAMFEMVMARVSAFACGYEDARIRIHLPSSCPERTLFRTVALSFMPCGP